MPLFTLHRNYLMNTTKGFSIRFVKDKPVHVPPRCVEDAIAIGARPVDPDDGDILGEEEKAPSLTAEEREAKIFEAFGIMETRGERNDFTGTGIPDARRLPPLCGFEITSKERDMYWQRYKDKKIAEHDQNELDAKTAQTEAADAED